MRAIKFRAWHEREQKMYPVAGTLLDTVMLSTGEDSLTGYSVDQVELMQFTGLKTRSGQEVYESDILKTSAGRLLLVLWHEAAFCWDVPGLNSEGAQISFSMLEHYSFEVIGNIYENPELLPAKE